MRTQSLTDRIVYWKPEEKMRKWRPIPDTPDARRLAVKQGSMFFTWASLSEPYTGNGQPEPRRYGDFPLDFDSKADVGLALEQMATLCTVHLPELYNVDPYAINYYLSGGKGFHNIIPAQLFDATNGDPYLPLIYEKIASQWKEQFGLTTLDLSLYSMRRGKMFRVANVRRKNGLYKVPLSLEELQLLGAQELVELGKAPRQIEPVEFDLTPNAELTLTFQTLQGQVYTEIKAKQERPAVVLRDDAVTDPRRKKYGEKALAGACQDIRESQPGKQHQTRISQATNIGGFIPTGYIGYDQALNALEAAVAASGAEDMSASMRDIKDGLDHGETIPRDPIGEQDAEREAIQQEPPPEYERAAIQEEPPPKTEQKQKPQFEFIHNSIILETLKPIEWQIKDIFCTNSFYYDFGDSGSFKSFIALDRLLCIAAGIPYHGHPVKQGTVFYIAGEGQQGIGRRISAWHIAHKTKAAEIPLFVAKTPTQLMDPGAVDGVRQAVDALSREYGPPAVLHIDTLARNFGEGDENATKDMNRVIANMDAAFGNEFCRGITHHTGHTNKDRARGSIALHGAADTAYRFVLKDSQQVFVECKKMKDAAYAPAMLFDLNEVKLIIGDTFDSSYSLCLAAEGDDALCTESSNIVRASGQMKKALSLLDDMYEKYERNLAADGRSETIPRVEINDWRSACITEGHYKRRDNFNRALGSMKERKLVYFDDQNRFAYSVSNYLKYHDKTCDFGGN